MKTCPLCGEKIRGLSGNPDPRPHVIRCPHCHKLLRKKISIWFPLLLLGFIPPVAYLKTHWIFIVWTVAWGVLCLAFYAKLPYVPYE